MNCSLGRVGMRWHVSLFSVILFALTLFATTGASFASQLGGGVPEGSGLNWTLLPVDDARQPEYGVWYDWVMENKKLNELDPSSSQIITPVGDYFVRPQMEGKGFELTVERAFARPGDRWIDLFVETERDWLSAKDVHYDVRLFPFGHSSPVAQEKFRPDGRVGLIQVDLRRHNLKHARLNISLIAGGKRIGMAEVSLSAQAPLRPIEPGERITIDVDTPEGHTEDGLYPVTFGVPFPAGSLWDIDDLRLVDGKGNEIPSQSEVIGLWGPDGSVKWVRFDALAQPNAGLFVEAGRSRSGNSNLPTLRLTEEAGRVVIDTGVAEYVLAKGPSPIQEIKMDGKTVATSKGARGLYVVDQRERVGIASADEESMVVESRGPVAASVRFEGFYRTVDGTDLARHITRIEAFAGQSAVKVTHTLILTNNTNSVWFKDIGWELAVDPGVNPEAIFGHSRQEPHQFVVQSINRNTPSAYMLQESHFRFGAGENVYKVAGIDRRGRETLLSSGEEMGDWAALVGSKGGLVASVREAALQHPKEFEVEEGRMIIRLFSNRAGEELDFRFDTLADRWNLGTLRPEDRNRLQSTNAIGWSKSHELLLSPLPAGSDGNDAAQVSLLNSRPVYAHVDPHWIYESKAMGSLHPKDPQRYPEAEALLDDLIANWKDMAMPTQGFYGFVDYYSGPTFAGGMGRRYRLTYTLRGDLWGVYARSGERWIRELAQGTNRAFMDNHLAHWSGPNKTKGLYLIATSSASGVLGRKGDYPFYWEERTDVELRSSTNLNQFIYDYYLTGNRRAKDVVEQFADGLKNQWALGALRRNERVIMHFRTLTQSYTFTWEPRLRALAQATAAYFYDPEGVTSLTKDRPGTSATYKVNADIRALIEGWNTYGTIPYYDMTRRVADYLLVMGLGLRPDGYTFPLAVAGEFIYKETGDPLIPRVLDQYVKWSVKLGRNASWHRGPASGTFLTEGFAVTQSVLEAAANDSSKSKAFWLAYDDDNGKYPVSIVTKKGVYDMIDIDIYPQLGQYVPADAPIGPGGAKVTPLEERIHQGIDLIGISTTLGMRNRDHAGFGATRISIPREAPGEEFQIEPLATGGKFVAARIKEPQLTRVSQRFSRPYQKAEEIPLVIYAPMGWILPRIPVDVYFKVPNNGSNMRIFFGDEVHLYDPQGEAVNNGRTVRGWYNLPEDNPGLWSFAPATVLRQMRVETLNLPPFFAMNDPKSYFEPQIPWVEWVEAPESGSTVRGQVPMELKVHTPAGLYVDSFSVSIGDDLIYRGSGASHSFVVDTRKFADGRYTITSHVRAGKALIELEIPINVGNEWEFKDSLGPINFFGRWQNASRTIETSDGWTFDTSNPRDFPGSVTRRRRAEDTSEYLVWEMRDEGLSAYTVGLFVPEKHLEAIPSVLELSVSQDGTEWTTLPYEHRSTDVSTAGWHRVELSGTIEPLNHPVRIKITVKGGVLPAEAIQFGNVVFSGAYQR